MPLIIGAMALAVIAGIYIVMSLSRFREGAGAMEQTARELLTRLQKIEGTIAEGERETSSELAQMRKEQREAAAEARLEQSRSVGMFGDSQAKRIREIGDLQRESLAAFSVQLSAISRLNEEKLEAMRKTFEEKIAEMQRGNEEKLEKMRATVDEQLHSTLEKRLGESFSTVSRQLEDVHRGLGEMRALTSDVGDLKRVLSNVKVRGTWGEMQLGTLLEQILTAEQYDTNVATRPGTAERVEFALRLPGAGDEKRPVYLPIDSKFPIEDYKIIAAASEAGDEKGIADAQKLLRARVMGEAKDIRDKYIEPPYTTDFGILYLPTEGLYAEVLRIDGLCEELSQKFRVVPSGPTTICALLNSLQMGFRTLAVEKRSSEVWTLLGSVKREFDRFGESLDKVRKRIDQAGKELENTDNRTRQITRQLSGVQSLPAGGGDEPRQPDDDRGEELKAE